MRRFMWFAVGFAAACAVGVYLLPVNILWIPMVICLPLGILLFLPKKTICRVLSLLLIGCFFGFLWLNVFEWTYLSHAREYDKYEGEIEAVICDYGQETAYGVSAEAKIRLEGRNYKAVLFLDQHIDLAPGDVVKGEFLLRLTVDREKMEFSNVVGKGIYLYAYPKDSVKIVAGEDSALAFVGVKMRKQIREAMEEIFPEKTLGFACALFLGDSSLLDYETDSAFTVSGIRHIVAVSGLHISILFALIYTFAGKNRTLTALLGIPALILFAAISGFTPSVTRACIMQVLMILALLMKQDYDGPTALAFAVFVMLLMNPMSVTSVSLQLSVLCVMGIFLFSEKIRAYLLQKGRLGDGKGKSLKARLARWLAGGVSVSLSAMVFTTPLCAVYFDTVSVVGVLTNLLTLWAVSLIFYGIMLACLLFWISPAIAGVIAAVVSLPMGYVVFMAKLLARIPFAAVYTYSVYVVAWLVFAYSLLMVFFAGKKKYPKAFLLGAVASLCVCITVSWIEPRLDDFRVSVLDVGQGQCVLLQTRGNNYVVDCGSDSGRFAADQAAKTLLSQGVFRLDGLILTHFDADHANGAGMLLKRVPADVIYLPSKEGDTELAENLKLDLGDSIRVVEEKLTIDLPNGEITLYPGEEGASENESSMCVLFQPEKYDILITGDRGLPGERALLKQEEIPQLELLVAGHHGAGNSTGLELLMQTKPANVAISVGADNRWGFPHEELLERLTWFGCRVKRTDRDGTILYRG